MNKILIQSVPFYFRILDYLMMPIMWALSGFALKRPQETHRWHREELDCALIDEAKAVFVKASETARAGDRVPEALHGIFVHIMFMSNWKDYVILEAAGFQKYWHVGWKIHARNGSSSCRAQKLRIYSPCIKLLIGSRDAAFFGINEKGEQILLRVVGNGTIGDGKFSNVRLF